MCGIAGLWTAASSASGPETLERAERMSARMRRRGPDDHGRWQDGRTELALVHRRLSVIDTSAAAHQPMLSPTGRSVLVYNGELYNFLELRTELEERGWHFRSQGDSEVLLAALECWGRDALPRLNGMFAFAWYDTRDESLLLARDHAGIKPLYYAYAAGAGFGFASQLDALLECPWVRLGDVDPHALRLLLQLGHVPAPYGLLRHTQQLPAGHWLRVERGGAPVVGRWWAPPEAARGELPLDELDAVLDRVVARQRLADVPLGVFLSGGVDSPLVAAVARRQVGSGLKTFIVSNPGWRQDERPAARAYAHVLDVDARFIEASPGNEGGAWGDVARAQYEPLGDFSILPTLAVSALARQDVTVALSGDGGDELFFGYERPFSLLRAGRAFRRLYAVRRLRYLLGRLHCLPQVSSVMVHEGPGAYYRAVNSRIDDHTLRALAPGLQAWPSGFDLYDSGSARDPEAMAAFARRAEYDGQLQRILKKVDMASMFYSLEVRVPLLDREIAELAFAMRPDTLVADGVRKKHLCDLLATYVPRQHLPKSKLGFAVPVDEWLLGPLRGVVETHLLEGPLYPEGLLDRAAVRRYWEGFCAGKRGRKFGLWTLLSLQAWARRQAREGGR